MTEGLTVSRGDSGFAMHIQGESTLTPAYIVALWPGVAVS